MSEIINVKLPQDLALSDNFQIWRDKINYGFEIQNDIKDKADKEIDRINGIIDDMKQEASDTHNDIYNTINEGNQVLDVKIDTEINNLKQEIKNKMHEHELDVMGLIIALG